MNDLAASLKKIYIEKLTKTFSPEKLLIFFILLLGLFYIGTNSKEGSFVVYVREIRFEDLLNKKTGPIAELTIGNIFFASILTYINSVIYQWIKRISFSYLSSTKGFDADIRRWVRRTQDLAPEGTRYDTEFMKTLRARINSSVSHIISRHLWGEVFLSIFTVILISLKTFNIIDLVFCMSLAILIAWLQRYTYVFYLTNVLPEMVSEATFLGVDFSHSRFLEEELSKTLLEES